MGLTEQISAIAIGVDFLFGVAVGIFGCASFASRREDCAHSLLAAAPDPACDGARVIHGVYVRRGRAPDPHGTERDR